MSSHSGQYCCTVAGCNFTSPRGYNLRRHMKQMHDQMRQSVSEEPRDAARHHASDDESAKQYDADVSRALVPRSAIQMVKPEPTRKMRIYHEAGELIYGLGPAAATETLIQELMMEFAFPHDLAKAIAVASRAVATGVASLALEVDTMTRRQGKPAYTRSRSAA